MIPEPPATTTYRVRERSLSLGGDFWIETADGERVLRVDGEIFDDRGTSVLESPAGVEVYAIHSSDPGTRKTMRIEQAGRRVATVEKNMAGLHRRYSVETEAGDALSIEGDLLARAFSVTREGTPVARISDRWFGVHHAIAVDIAPGEDDALILAAILCVDWMARA